MAVVLTVSHWRKSRGMLCYPFLCVITLRALQEYGRHTGTQSSTEQQQKGWTVKYPLACLWLWGIYFLSRNMTSAGTSSAWAPSAAPQSQATAIPPSHPLLLPIGRKGGVILAQRPFLRRHLACVKTNWSRLWEKATVPFWTPTPGLLHPARCKGKMIHGPGSCFLVWYLVCHWDEKNKDDCSTLHQKDERVWERELGDWF